MTVELTDLKSREDIGGWLVANGMIGDSLEIGVYEASFASRILSTWPGRLHLVDLWEPQDTAVYLESPHIDFPAVEKLARERMLPFGERAVFHKMLSEEAFTAFDKEDRRFDFCYIDANHSGDAVRADIRNWFQLVARGGVLSGHDFFEVINDGVGEHCKDIAPIVRAFAEEMGMELHLTTEDFPVSWFLQKPS